MSDNNRVHTTSAADFTSAERLQFEKELLGFYVSGHPLNAYSGLAESLCTHTEETVLLEGDRVEFRLCGIMSGINKKLSKKDNRPWAFFNLVNPLMALAYAFTGFKVERIEPELPSDRDTAEVPP